MSTDELKIAADKHMARAHGYKMMGDNWLAYEQTQIAYHLMEARRIMAACAIVPDVAQ